MKLLITLSLLLIADQYCSAQGNTIGVVYNMHDSRFETDFPMLIKEGNKISLSYKDINPFAYKSNVVFTDINHNFLDGMDVVQSGLNSLSGPQEEAAAEVVKAKAMFALPVKTKAKLDKKEALLNSIQHHLTIIQRRIQTIDAIMTIDTLIRIGKNDRANFSSARMEASIMHPVAAYGITKDNIPDKFHTSQEDIYSSLSHIYSALNELKSLKEPGMKPLIDSLEKKVAVLNNIYTGTNAAILLKNVSIIQYNLTTVLNADYTLPPVAISTAKGDFIEISDELKDNADKKVFTIAPHKIRTYGGTRVDFSIGLTAGIGGNGSNYSLRKNPTDAKTGDDTARVSLYKSSKNKLIQFNPGVFIHWYKTTKHNIQWMLSTGFSPDFSTLANSRLFIGTSLGFPSSNDLGKRLVLSIGMSVGYADVLKNKYRDWNNYKRFADIDDADLTEKAPRVGGFFAVSYNLGGTGHTK
ncbi:hypothetical protein [Chitinophaga agri]|uniref:Outer membrane protein beta-barrel domain-containing protein n=1 Tax=Chitinophaga agri TaxID=2703787 RepID=A0A6B9Z8M2_9BACT|nr:hypothetical protein [Chitinophaga agri]QHS58347.1 hypothetical protein GWR21_01675 [Chitinophaga agri]